MNKKTFQVSRTRKVSLSEAPSGFGPLIRVLQTLALPLGHGAIVREYI